MAYKERSRDKKYWDYWEEMVKASTARNTVELPALLGIVDFEGKKVLDAGSGIGRAAFKIQGFCEKLTALDKNDFALKALREGIKAQGLEKKVSAVQGSLEKIPFSAKNSFDIVYSLWALHHLKPDWKLKLSELNRVCRKKGCVIVCFSTEKGSIPELEALTRPKELELRKQFTQQVAGFLKKLNGNSSVKKVMLPFYFKNANWAFEVLSNTFLPKPLTALQEKKCIAFLKKRSNAKGCFLDEECAFVYSFKT